MSVNERRGPDAPPLETVRYEVSIADVLLLLGERSPHSSVLIDGLKLLDLRSSSWISCVQLFVSRMEIGDDPTQGGRTMLQRECIL